VGAEVRIEHPQPRTLRVCRTQVHDEAQSPSGQVLVCTDITDLKELDALKTELVSIASHELRTPLTSIKSYTSTLRHRPDLSSERAQEYVLIIDHECDRLRRMVAGLLNLSRIESGRALAVNRRRIDLASFLERLREMQAVYAPDHPLCLVSEVTSRALEADPEQLEQIFSNLISNASKYSPPGTPITVTVREEEDQFACGVADEGEGIPAEEIPELFQKYHRLGRAQERNIQGSGLGLYLTKHLVEAHGGRIWVESETGSGTRFYFSLPKVAWTGE
jgi:signal transduction histidine kinase